MYCSFNFGFKASNNESEYEALIAGLNLVKEMKVESLEIYSDSSFFRSEMSIKREVRK